MTRNVASTHRDREIRAFYWITEGVAALVLILAFATGEWKQGNGWMAVVGGVLVGFAFGAFGWPLSATVVSPQEIRFRNLLFTRTVRAGQIRRLKYVRVAAGDHVTIKLRSRAPIVGYRFDIGYRAGRFTDPGPLTAAMLALAASSRDCIVDEGAQSMLARIAAG